MTSSNNAATLEIMTCSRERQLLAGVRSVPSAALDDEDEEEGEEEEAEGDAPPVEGEAAADVPVSVVAQLK